MSLKRIVVNGVEEQIDYNALANLPDLDAKQDLLEIDWEPTENSSNPISSGGVYAALQNFSGGSGSGDITVDYFVSEGSTDPVTSGAVFNAIQDAIDAIDTNMNATDSELRADIESLETAVANKVDAVAGKGLSTCDFTSEYQLILARNRPGLLDLPTAQLLNKVPTVHNVGGIYKWVYVTIDELIPNAEDSEF